MTVKEYASGFLQLHLIDESARIGCITINNPNKRNALSRSMWFGLSEILDDCEKSSPPYRVLIITGQGTIAFSSGADLTEKEPEEANEIIPNIRKRLLHYPIPIIAQINGFCLGGGLALAMNTDFRFASSNASFSIPAVKLGVPCPKDIVHRLIELVGESHGKRILFSGDRISADEAQRIGLIQHICDDSEKLAEYVTQFAHTLAQNAPLSIRAIKTMIEHKNDDDQILNAVKACMTSKDIDEGRRAFREKRAPQFQGC